MIEGWVEYREVNRALRDLVDSIDSIDEVKDALKHIISAGGKRTRPVIALLSGELCGGGKEDVMNVALAVELIHTASLAHDDVIDRGVMRRNVETLHVKYDTAIAILVGDWLISKSIELVSIYSEEVIRDFARIGMLMAEGEILDVYSTKKEFGEKEYFRCIESKTASLFAFSAESACKIVSEDRKAVEKMYEYGNNLGIAYQLVDDLLEYLEILEDKKSEFESRTLPMIYEEKYGYEEAVERTLEHIRSYSERSVESLDYFDDCESKEKLLKMVEYMTTSLLKNYVMRNRESEVLELLEKYC